MTARVLVTHPAGAWPALEARFRGTNVVLEMSETTVAVDPIDPRRADDALGHLDRYTWLVVTSGRGASALVRRLAVRGMTSLPRELRVAAVGPGTARALSGIGARSDLVAVDASSDGLAAALTPLLANGARVLVVRPEGTPGALATTLRAAGAAVDEAPLYRTVASERCGELADAAIAGAFVAVAFTAPSSLDLWLGAAGARRDALVGALSRAARVAIGPTTSAHLTSSGLPADAVADVPSEEAIGDAITRVLPR